MGTLVIVIIICAFLVMIFGSIIISLAEVFAFILGWSIIIGLIIAGALIISGGSSLGWVLVGLAFFILVCAGSSDD